MKEEGNAMRCDAERVEALNAMSKFPHRESNAKYCTLVLVSVLQ